MYITVKKWGNSTSIRIPAIITKSLNIEPEPVVGIREEQGRVIIEPVRKNANKRKYSLDSLLSQITDDNRHNEVDFGKHVGEEVW